MLWNLCGVQQQQEINTFTGKKKKILFALPKGRWVEKMELGALEEE